MTSRRWQDWLLLLGGAWLFIAPWALDTSYDSNSSWNAWTVGVLVVVAALWALAIPADQAPEWLQVVLGAWLFVAPWLLDFSGLAEAGWNAWLVSGGIVAVSLWAIAQLAAPRAAGSGSTRDTVVHGSH